MARLKLLYELEFRELKEELRDRDLKTSGNKETLQARLRECIVEEEEDPDTYLFEVAPDFGEFIRAMSVTLKKYTEDICREIKEMGTSVTSPVVKTMDEVEETLYDQRDLKDKGAAPSLNNELLPTQSFEEICSDNGNADECGAACQSENREYRPVEPKETDEETMEAAHSSNEACDAAVPDMSTSNSKTYQVNVCSASKHFAEERLQVASGVRRWDPTDACPDSKTSERSPDGDHKNPMKSDEAVEGHLQAKRYQPGPYPTAVGPAAKTGEGSPDGGKENPRQSDVDIDGHLKDESNRQGLKPTSDWPDTETRERGPDGGEESRMEPEAEDEGPLHLECCQPAPRACTPDKAEDDDLFHNSLSCGFESHPSPSSQSPMKPPLLPTILVMPALTSYTSPCVNWLPSVPNDKRAMQLRHCNKKTINWRKRRRRRLLSPTWMTMQPRYHCNHMKTNWRRRRRRRLLLSAKWMTMRSRGRYNQKKANWRRRKRFLNSTWMAMKARRPCNQVKTNWRRRRKRPLLTATWMAPSSSRGKPTATDRPPPAAMKLYSQCHDC